MKPSCVDQHMDLYIKHDIRAFLGLRMYLGKKTLYVSLDLLMVTPT